MRFRWRARERPKAVGPPQALFPKTSWTLLVAIRAGDSKSSQALGEFWRRYHRPAYGYVSAILGVAQEAEDLTDEFFTSRVVSGTLLANYDRGKGSFRPYLKQALRNFVIDWRRRKQREPVAIAPPEEDDGWWDRIAQDRSPAADEEFDHAWVRSLLDRALAEVRDICRRRGQDQHLAIFTAHYLCEGGEPASWEDLARAYDLADGKQARNRAETVARHFGLVLRAILAEELESDQAVEEEIAALFALFS